MSRPVSLFAGGVRHAGGRRARVSDFLNQRKRERKCLSALAACGDGEAALDIYRDALAGMKEVENEIIDVKPY